MPGGGVFLHRIINSFSEQATCHPQDQVFLIQYEFLSVSETAYTVKQWWCQMYSSWELLCPAWQGSSGPPEVGVGQGEWAAAKSGAFGPWWTWQSVVGV